MRTVADDEIVRGNVVKSRFGDDFVAFRMDCRHGRIVD